MGNIFQIHILLNEVKWEIFEIKGYKRVVTQPAGFKYQLSFNEIHTLNFDQILDYLIFFNKILFTCFQLLKTSFISCSRHWTTKFPNSESPIFTTKFCLSYFLLDQKSAAPSITLSKRPSKKCVSQKINKKVNKQHIRNSENWLFDDVSEILVLNYFNFKNDYRGSNLSWYNHTDLFQFQIGAGNLVCLIQSGWLFFKFCGLLRILT